MDGGTELDALAEGIAGRLLARGETLAVAETSTGGLLGTILARQPGAGTWFAGAIVAYAVPLQTAWLGVSATTVREFGAVSREVVRELAQGARQRFGATWGLAETGIAGPQTGRRSSKPAGLAFLAVAGPSGLADREMATGHDRRIENKAAFARGALALLAARLDGE